jgi:hypothetical protein
VWLRDYGLTPGQIDEMTVNDVYSILYARKHREINKRFAEVIKTAAPASSDFLTRLGA